MKDKTKKKLAWHVTDGEASVIIAHHHGLAARREGSEYLGIEFCESECTRAKEFDKYANNIEKLTYKKLVNEYGWWMFCHQCTNQVFKDDISTWINDQATCKKCIARIDYE